MKEDEKSAALIAHRIRWIRAKHEEKLKEYHFANGMRAGLECALYALEGRDIMGHSIDPSHAKGKKR